MSILRILDRRSTRGQHGMLLTDQQKVEVKNLSDKEKKPSFVKENNEIEDECAVTRNEA